MIKPTVFAFVLVASLAGSTVTCRSAVDQTNLHFDFGTGAAKAGSQRVEPTNAYSDEKGFGFEGSPTLAPVAGGVSATRPFMFSVKLPEGNYRVTATLGDGGPASVVTIKSENRRLMVEQAPVAAGKFETRIFTANVHTPKIEGGKGEVKLTGREQGPPLALRWDDKLTLEFNGTRPSLSALEISRDDTATTVYVAGDSTTTDQAAEPWAGWGQMLPRFFQPSVAVSNHAESGLALSSFKAQNRLTKILSEIKKGDYLFIQFGHNDQKDKGEGAGPFTTYKQRLKDFVQATRAAGGNVVLVTPMERRRFDPQGQPSPTLAEYAEAVRQVGQEDNVPVIDLNAMSMKFYAALGPQDSTKAFVHYPAGTFPGQSAVLKDDTHHNGYGGYELARCIVEGIKSQVPALAKMLVTGLPTFDPSHPDPAANFDVPPSTTAAAEKPAGS